MPNLSLTFAYPLRIVSEPGYYQLVTSRQLAEDGNPSDSASHQAFWSDEATRTLMLRPLQLDPTWLNTAQQLDSIIRLADMVVDTGDVAANSIFEQAGFGNADNPYIYHIPVGPAAAFIGGALTALAGIDTHMTPGLTLLETAVQYASKVFQPSVTVPPTPPTITQVGSQSDGRFLFQTKDRMDANQALFFRWFHPSSHLGFPNIYHFYVGQFCLRVKGSILEVFEDTSSAGDRTAWTKRMRTPLFSPRDFSAPATGTVMPEVPNAAADLAHDRSLLWLPYRQNQILLLASTGQWAILTGGFTPFRLPDNSDWSITRSDTVAVWTLFPSAGHFQLQKVKYPAGPVKVQAPPLVLDYTPSGALTATINADHDYGSSVTITQTTPPSYTALEDPSSDCPKPTTAATDQRATIGLELTFNPSSDQRHTPFFYSASLVRPRTFTTYPGTPVTVGDVAPGNSDWVRSVTLRTGLRPGDGAMEAEVSDLSPFALTIPALQSGFPVQLFDPAGPTPYFTGIAKPVETTPLPGGSTTAHRLVVPATDLWDLLSWGRMRDMRSQDGVGHIDAVRSALAQGGVDPATAEFPAGYTPGAIDGIWNTPLGLAAPNIAQQSGDVVQGWAPRVEDTPATFILRIADLFSAWNVGFRLDGTFFYLPRYYFTTPTVVFEDAHAGGTPPFIYPPVTFSTEEPEANVIVVRCADPDGTIRYSSAMIDWASIFSTAAPNFLGREKREVILIGGTYHCPQLNYMARVIWTWTRRRRYLVRFEADFVPSLGIGHMVTVANQGNFRIQSIRAKLEHSGLHRASYEALFDDKGYA